MASTNDISIEIDKPQKTRDFTTHPGVIKRQKQIEQRRQNIEKIYSCFNNVIKFDYHNYCVDSIKYYYNNTIGKCFVFIILNLNTCSRNTRSSLNTCSKNTKERLNTCSKNTRSSINTFSENNNCLNNICSKNNKSRFHICSKNIMRFLNIIISNTFECIYDCIMTNTFVVLFVISFLLLFINEIKTYNLYWKENIFFGLVKNNSIIPTPFIKTPCYSVNDTIKDSIFNNSIPQCFTHTFVNHYSNHTHNIIDLGFPIFMSIVSTFGSLTIISFVFNIYNENKNKFALLLFIPFHIPMSITLSSILRITQLYNASLFWYSQLWVAIFWIFLKLIYTFLITIAILIIIGIPSFGIPFLLTIPTLYAIYKNYDNHSYCTINFAVYITMLANWYNFIYEFKTTSFVWEWYHVIPYNNTENEDKDYSYGNTNDFGNSLFDIPSGIRNKTMVVDYFNESLPICITHIFKNHNDLSADTIDNNIYEHSYTDTFIPSVLSVFGFIGNCMIVCRLVFMSNKYKKVSYYITTFLMILVTISSVASLLKTFQTYNHGLFYMAQTVLLGFRMILSFAIILLMIFVIGYSGASIIYVIYDCLCK